MLRLTFVFVVSFSLSFLLLWGTAGTASPLFDNINAILYVLGALFGALSLAFFNYVEGVMKDVPKKLKLKNAQAYIMVVTSLTELKSEVVANVCLVVVLLVLMFVVGAIGEMEFIREVGVSIYWFWGALSVRGACLLSVLIVVFVQLSGFITANNLRAEISMLGE
jgi:hypothetical protein